MTGELPELKNQKRLIKVVSATQKTGDDIFRKQLLQPIVYGKNPGTI